MHTFIYKEADKQYARQTDKKDKVRQTCSDKQDFWLSAEKETGKSCNRKLITDLLKHTVTLPTGAGMISAIKNYYGSLDLIASSDIRVMTFYVK